MHCFFHFISLLHLVKIPMTYANNKFPANLHSGFGRLEGYIWLVEYFRQQRAIISHSGITWRPTMKKFPAEKKNRFVFSARISQVYSENFGENERS